MDAPFSCAPLAQLRSPGTGRPYTKMGKKPTPAEVPSKAKATKKQPPPPPAKAGKPCAVKAKPQKPVPPAAVAAKSTPAAKVKAAAKCKATTIKAGSKPGMTMEESWMDGVVKAAQQAAARASSSSSGATGTASQQAVASKPRRVAAAPALPKPAPATPVDRITGPRTPDLQPQASEPTAGQEGDQAIQKLTEDVETAVMARLAEEWKDQAMQAEIQAAEAAAALADTQLLEELEASLPSGAWWVRVMVATAQEWRRICGRAGASAVSRNMRRVRAPA